MLFKTYQKGYKIKFFGFFVCLFFALPSPMSADSKTDSASKLSAIMIEQRLIDENFDKSWSYIEAMIIRKYDITEKIRLRLNDLKRKVWIKVKDKMRSKKFRDEFAGSFLEVFNEDELMALLEFYNTDIGKSILRKSPVLRDSLMLSINNSLRMETENFSDEIADIIILIKLENKDNHLLKGDHYMKNNKYIKAIEEYEAGLKEDENNPNLLNNYAWALVSCPKELCYDPNKAIQLAQKALKIKEAPYILDTLAAAYAELGNYKKSTEILQDILNKKDENGVKKQNIAHFEKCLKAYSKNTTCIDN